MIVPMYRWMTAAIAGKTRRGWRKDFLLLRDTIFLLDLL